MGRKAESVKRRRTTVKTGCQTCKIRKVKCDEGRPVCGRCLSTGRVCDGYGIWGGGGNYYHERQRCPVSKTKDIGVPRPGTFLSLLVGTVEERYYYEWLTSRTAKKIPGAFVTGFWKSLLFQACITEPAVLHASLTLSAIHKRDIHYDDSDMRCDDTPDEQEQFLLHQYTEAIRHLQPHFLSKAKESRRIALITCIVFTCLELLRGHFRTAQTHLQHGLKVLGESTTPDHIEGGVLILKPSRNIMDDCIAEAFSRLHVQTELFKQTYYHPSMVIYISLSLPAPCSFNSFNHAWQPLERIIHQIFHLTEQGRRHYSSTNPFIPSTSTLLAQQHHIQSQLTQWLSTYTASKSDLQAQDPRRLGCRLLCIYHAMTSVMLATCLRRPDDEAIYDTCTPLFQTIITVSAEMWKIGSSQEREYPMGEPYMDMSRSLVDVGWIPPLYYTALKCRVHRFRAYSIRLLESASHREGIWDSRITAAVARRIMEMEEWRFCKETALAADEFSLGNSPELQDWEGSIVPDECRACEVKVELVDGPADSVLVALRRVQSARWEYVRVDLRGARYASEAQYQAKQATL